MDYAAVGQGVGRFGRRLQQDATRRRQVRQIEARLSKIEM